MKILSTLGASLVLYLFLNIQTCQSLSSAKLSYAVTNLITGEFKFGQNFWQELDNPEIMEYLQNYMISVEFERIRDDIMRVLKNSIDTRQLNQHFINLETDLLKMDLLYNQMKLFRNYEINPSSDNKISDSRSALSHKTDELLNSARDIRLSILFHYSNIFQNLSGSNKDYTKTCSTGESQQSVQSMLYNLFTLLVTAEIKVFCVVNVAAEILDWSNEPTGDITDRVINLNKEHKRMADVFKVVMLGTSTNVWRCEPDSYKEDDSYTKLKHVFQVYFRAPEDIKEDGSGGFKDICNTPQGWIFKTVGGGEREPRLCPHRNCAGSLWDCEDSFKINGLHNVSICISKKDSDRTYDFVKKFDFNYFSADERHSYGEKNNGTCDGTVYESRKTGKAFTFKYCTCDDDLEFGKNGSLSERRFYTGVVMANVLDNRVVTGAKLRKEKGIIYIQIQTGRLLPGGNIDNSTLEWQKIPEDELMNSTNHYKLSFGTKDIELQDINIRQGHALVGLKFDKVIENNIGRLGLAAFSQPFYFNEGKVMHNAESFYRVENFSNDYVETEGSKLPDGSLSYNVVESNKYVSFKKSDYESDFGQTTVPFLDTQDVTASHAYPLSGIGLFYRRNLNDSYTGFLSLKLKTYDFYKHLPNLQ